ncbi:MAG: succinate dehydrogenase, hydrophobic membrane anchor protein [Candidatus Aureabacteria bacterium]|nr:succinate dehydrogenase, hydrophobic membrane anchor protein [Candidatus Auribacterota bacterium]
MRQTGSYTWLFQRLSGALLFVMLAAHFILMHYMGFEKRLYADVLRRLSNPLWKTFDLVFLSLALYHGWYGVWAVAQDYLMRDAWRIICLIVIVTLGCILFSLGLVTIVSFHA